MIQISVVESFVVVRVTSVELCYLPLMIVRSTGFPRGGEDGYVSVLLSFLTFKITCVFFFATRLCVSVDAIPLQITGNITAGEKGAQQIPYDDDEIG